MPNETQSVPQVQNTCTLQSTLQGLSLSSADRVHNWSGLCLKHKTTCCSFTVLLWFTRKSSFITHRAATWLNLRVLKSHLPWSEGTLWQECILCSRIPVIRAGLDVWTAKDKEHRRSLRDLYTSRLKFHFGGPFWYFHKSVRSCMEGTGREEGNLVKVWDTREGNSCLWDYYNVWVQEKESFCFHTVCNFPANL